MYEIIYRLLWCLLRVGRGIGYKIMKFCIELFIVSKDGYFDDRYD